MSQHTVIVCSAHNALLLSTQTEVASRDANIRQLEEKCEQLKNNCEHLKNNCEHLRKKCEQLEAQVSPAIYMLNVTLLGMHIMVCTCTCTLCAWQVIITLTFVCM